MLHAQLADQFEASRRVAALSSVRLPAASEASIRRASRPRSPRRRARSSAPAPRSAAARLLDVEHLALPAPEEHPWRRSPRRPLVHRRRGQAPQELPFSGCVEGRREPLTAVSRPDRSLSTPRRAHQAAVAVGCSTTPGRLLPRLDRSSEQRARRPHPLASGEPAGGEILRTRSASDFIQRAARPSSSGRPRPGRCPHPSWGTAPTAESAVASHVYGTGGDPMSREPGRSAPFGAVVDAAIAR